ncbi:MAG: DMT family transporter [Desulfobulbaceae bacterium]|nr:DMT family transporter [Desulfobulbaceae bacterium]
MKYTFAKNRDIVGILAAVASALLMGTIGVFSKSLGATPEVITFCRLFFGAVFMGLFLLLINRINLLKKWPTWPVLLTGLMLAGFIIFYVQAMNMTTMANAIMLVYLAPVTASVFAHFFLGERMGMISVILICCALFGFAMMMEFRIDLNGTATHAGGVAFGLLSMIAYAAFILLNRTISKEVHVYTRAFYQMLAGSCVVLPLALFELPSVPTVHWFWLACVGFCPGFLAILFAVSALSRLPAAVFGTLAYVEPVAVILFGWLLFNESLGPFQAGGCLIIIISGIAQTCLCGKKQ